MRSILTGFMKRRLKAETRVDDVKVHEQQLDDPFLTTTTVVGWGLWDWVKMLFKRPRQIVVRTRVLGDAVADRRWFCGMDGCDHCGSIIGFSHDVSNASDPSYHNGDERLCAACYYGIEHPLPLHNVEAGEAKGGGQ